MESEPEPPLRNDSGSATLDIRLVPQTIIFHPNFGAFTCFPLTILLLPPVFRTIFLSRCIYSQLLAIVALHTVCYYPCDSVQVKTIRRRLPQDGSQGPISFPESVATSLGQAATSLSLAIKGKSTKQPFYESTNFYPFDRSVRIRPFVSES